MHQVQTAFQDDTVRFETFTVDPARDTPPVLAAYAQHFEATPGKWFFLTGAIPDLNRMSRGVFMTRQRRRQPGTLHALRPGRSLRSNPRLLPDLRSRSHPHPIADARRLLKEQHPDRPPRSPRPERNSERHRRRPAGHRLHPDQAAPHPSPQARDDHRVHSLQPVLNFLSDLSRPVGSVHFPHPGPIRIVYLTILGTHTLLAAAVPVLAIITLRRGLKGDFVRHNAIARWTLPIWLYVSMTGVIVYLMLYQY